MGEQGNEYRHDNPGPPPACPECASLRASLVETSQEAWIKHHLQMARDTEVARLREERDAACAERDAAEMDLASATDLANVYARETGVAEAENVAGLRGVIERLGWKSNERATQMRAFRADVERLRAKNRDLNERATKAEGLLDRSGLVEGRPQGAHGRSLGRALANYAAAKYQRERDEAIAESETRGALLAKLDACLKGHMIGVNCHGPVLDDATVAELRAALAPKETDA